ncbi:Gustatory receptor 10, partial [Hyalella azteca]
MEEDIAIENIPNGLVNLLYFSVFMIRLIGGFPFRIELQSMTEMAFLKEDPSKVFSIDIEGWQKKSFKKSPLWQVYNVFALVLIMTCAIFLAESVSDAPAYYSVRSKTLQIAMHFSNLLEISMSTLGIIYLAKNRHLLCSLLFILTETIAGIKKEKMTESSACQTISLAIVFCLASGGITVIQLSQIFEEFSSYILVEVIMVTIFTSLKLGVCSLYLAGTLAISYIYEGLTFDFALLTRDDEHKRPEAFIFHKRGPQINPYEVKFSEEKMDSQNKVERHTTKLARNCHHITPPSHHPAVDNMALYRRVNSEDYLVSDQAKYGEMIAFLRACYGRLLATYQSQEILHHYVGLPVCILLLYALCSGIISMFFLTHYQALPVAKIIVVCLYLVAAVCPMMFLINLPSKVLAK